MVPRTTSILLTILFLAPALPLSAVPIEVGDPFPVLTLPLAGDEGRQMSIEAFRGRKMMLHLFASW